MTQRAPLSPWWWLKLAASSMLIVYVAVALIRQFRIVPLVSLPPTAGQLLVIAGGAIYLLCTATLKRRVADIGAPAELVTSGGLYGVIRHPMYLADAIWTLGLAMLVGDLPALALWLVTVAGAIGQARVEDAWLARRFGDAHVDWRARTRLIIPLVY